MAGTRPGGVTLVALIAWLSGFFQTIQGIWELVAGGQTPSESTTSWVVLAIGVVTLAVGVGLFRGSNPARILVTLVFLLNIAGAIYLLVTQLGGFWTAFIPGLLALIGLLFLYTARANAFFRG